MLATTERAWAVFPIGTSPPRAASAEHVRARHPPASDADALLPWPSCTELWRQAAVAARSCRVLHALQAWQLTCAAERHMRGRFARHLLPHGQPRAWRRGRAFDGRSWAHLDRFRSLLRHLPSDVGRRNDELLGTSVLSRMWSRGSSVSQALSRLARHVADTVCEAWNRPTSPPPCALWPWEAHLEDMKAAHHRQPSVRDVKVDQVSCRAWATDIPSATLKPDALPRIRFAGRRSVAVLIDGRSHPLGVGRAPAGVPCAPGAWQQQCSSSCRGR